NRRFAGRFTITRCQLWSKWDGAGSVIAVPITRITVRMMKHPPSAPQANAEHRRNDKPRSLTSALRFRFDIAVITRDDIAVRTIVDLPQEQIRKLTLFCRREKISRAEAVRRAVDRLLRGSPASDLRSFFGASQTRGKISRHVARLRQEWHKRRPARENFRS